MMLALTDTPHSTENGLKISEADWMIFKLFTSKELKPKILEAVKALNKRTANKAEARGD